MCGKAGVLANHRLWVVDAVGMVLAWWGLGLPFLPEIVIFQPCKQCTHNFSHLILHLFENRVSL